MLNAILQLLSKVGDFVYISILRHFGKGSDFDQRLFFRVSVTPFGRPTKPFPTSPTSWRGGGDVRWGQLPGREDIAAHEEAVQTLAVTGRRECPALVDILLALPGEP